MPAKIGKDFSICPKCGGSRYRRTNGPGWNCGPCNAAAAMSLRDMDRDLAREKHRRQYNKTRAKALTVLGNKCVKCGFDDPRALQIDHINGGGTKEHRAIGNAQVYRKVINGDQGYQCLCANCNWIKRFENFEHNCHTKRVRDAAAQEGLLN